MHQASVARWSGSKGKRRREIQGLQGSRGSGERPKGLGEIVKGMEDPRGKGRRERRRREESQGLQ